MQICYQKQSEFPYYKPTVERPHSVTVIDYRPVTNFYPNSYPSFHPIQKVLTSPSPTSRVVFSSRDSQPSHPSVSFCTAVNSIQENKCCKAKMNIEPLSPVIFYDNIQMEYTNVCVIKCINTVVKVQTYV